MSNQDRIRCSMEASWHTKPMKDMALAACLAAVGALLFWVAGATKMLCFLAILMVMLLVLLTVKGVIYRSLFRGCENYELMSVTLDTPGIIRGNRGCSYYFTVAIPMQNEEVLLVKTAPLWSDKPNKSSSSYDFSVYLGKRVEMLCDREKKRVIVLG